MLIQILVDLFYGEYRAEIIFEACVSFNGR